MKLLTHAVVYITFGLGFLFLQACNSSEPVATQYKNANPDGPGVAPPPPPGGNDGGDNGGDNNGGGDNPFALGDAAAGEAFYTGNNCGICHEGAIAEPVIGEAYPSFDDLKANFESDTAAPNHGGFLPIEDQTLLDLGAFFRL